MKEGTLCVRKAEILPKLGEQAPLVPVEEIPFVSRAETLLALEEEYLLMEGQGSSLAR